MALSLACAAALPANPAAKEPTREAIAVFDLCDNGDFAMPFWAPAEARLGTGIPWWRKRGGSPRLVDGALETGAGDAVSQPLATFAPFVAADPGGSGSPGLVLRGRVAGEGLLIVRDGAGREARFALGEGRSAGMQAFAIPAVKLEDAAGQPLSRGRLEVELRGLGTGARWDDIEFWVPLPAPTEAELAAELRTQVARIIKVVEARGLDRAGPRPTTFVVQGYDVVTGESLGDAALSPAGVGVFYETLLDLVALDSLKLSDPELATQAERLLDAHIPEFLALSFHADTHLARLFDPKTDAPLDDKPIEAARFLASLLDIAEHGPEATRAAGLEAAQAFGEAVLAGGVLPNGEVASRYCAATGVGDSLVPSIRKLDMPAELVRLGARTHDARYSDAALEALSEFEFLHMWSGSWDAIDPGLDDFYGHFGRRSVTMARAMPGHAVFPRLAQGGLNFFGPLWERTLAHGAFVAADEVRGWLGFLGVAELFPERAPEVAGLIDSAVRAHFKGELDNDGRWVDVSHNLWEPRFGLEVGDVPGVPVNLLHGLAVASSPQLGLDRAFMRSAYAAVLRTTIATYGRPYGLLASRVEARGANPSGSDLRLLPVLVSMLAELEPEH